jgi:hypothetical protein
MWPLPPPDEPPLPRNDRPPSDVERERSRSEPPLPGHGGEVKRFGSSFACLSSPLGVSSPVPDSNRDESSSVLPGVLRGEFEPYYQLKPSP